MFFISILIVFRMMIAYVNKDSLNIKKRDDREIVWTQLSKVKQK